MAIKHLSKEEFAASLSNHPFGKPAITFVPKLSSTRASSSPPAEPAPEENPSLPEAPPEG